MRMNYKNLILLLGFMICEICTFVEYSDRYDITHLICEGIKYTGIKEDAFKKFKKVNKLTIRNTSIYNFTEICTFLTNIKDLEIILTNEEARRGIRIDFRYLTSLQRLTISGFKMSSISDSIKLLKNLNYLNLSNNSIKKLDFEPKELRVYNMPIFGFKRQTTFSELQYLKELDLSKNFLTDLPVSLSESNSLQILNISNNDFKKIPSVLLKLNRLECLDLSTNFLSDMNIWDSRVRNITHLDLHNNLLKRIPEEIYLCPYLTYLDLSHNFLEDLPFGIAALSRLEYIDISQNKLDFVPLGIFFIEDIKILKLHSNQIKSLKPTNEQVENMNKTFTNFEKSIYKDGEEIRILYGLELDPELSKAFKEIDNRIHHVLDGICSLKKLLVLDLSRNQIDQIPKEIGKCKKLLDINLSYNNLTCVFSYITEVTELKYLNLSFNKIKGVARLDRLQNLESLDISNNVLSSFKSFTQTMPLLTKLDLSKNRLTEIYPENLKCPSLISLDLSYNRISYFDIDLGGKYSLIYLDLSYNELSFVPESIRSLMLLKNLNLSNNNITSVDFLLFQHDNVEYLDLSKNEIRILKFCQNNLKELKILNLSQNIIESICGIDILVGLTDLNLSSNLIESIPNDLKKLKKLRKLDVSRNFIPTKTREGCFGIFNFLNIHTDSSDISKLKKLKIESFNHENQFE